MFKHSLIAAALFGAGLFGLSAAPATAMPVVMQPAVQSGTADLKVDVADRHDRRWNRRYNRGWDNRSNRHWDNRWDRRRHYYGSRYNSPFWALPLVGTGVVIGSTLGNGYYAPRAYRGGNSHVRWCLDRYRSYNVRSNTWVSYNGEVRQCRSPYRY
jgi:hypothetical protein